MNTINDINLKELIEKETGQRFVKDKIFSPFKAEKTASFSIYFDSNANKMKFKDFATGKQGDVFDFLREFKNLDYTQARKYLGLEVEKTEEEKNIDKIKNYIEWQIGHLDGYFNCKCIGIFQYVDENNKPLYYKAKIVRPDGKKFTPYYSIQKGKVENKRGLSEEVPYNLYEVIEGLKNKKVLIVVEGEKDVNTLKYILKNKWFVTTSIKNVKNFDILKDMVESVYVIGDTGEAGERYINYVKNVFYDNASCFKIIKLQGLNDLGDNKDITDWLESGYSKDDLFRAFAHSLDLKSIFEFQQDRRGIYKKVKKKDSEEYKRVDITNFQIEEARKLIYADSKEEGIYLKLKTDNGTYERTGKSTVFDSLKDFKNFLGSIDLTFQSDNSRDFTDLKIWINKYFAIDTDLYYKSDVFTEINSKLYFVTCNGALTKDKIDKHIFSEQEGCDIIDKEKITIEELMELKSHIFRFATPDKTTCIIGTIINNLAVWQNEKCKCHMHHLLIVGESGAGKTAILDDVISPILNLPLLNTRVIKDTSKTAMQMSLCNGNYTSIYDEFKPSMLPSWRVEDISDILRSSYARKTISKSNRSFTVNNFQYGSPIIIAGEENYPNSEKALIERSCIVYLSRRERTANNTESMEWIINNEKILNKFGRSLIDVVLNMSVEDYKAIRNELSNKFNFKERIQNTALNIACGIEIFNKLLEKHGLKKITDYEKFISANINNEVLSDTGEVKTTVEQMLTLFDEMLVSGRVTEPQNIVIDRGDGLFIKTNEMIDYIFKFIKEFGSAEVVPIKASDFKKQAEKAGYLIKKSAKVLPISIGGKKKSARFDEYSKEMIRKLKLDNICEPDVTLVEMSKEETNVIEGLFGNSK